MRQIDVAVVGGGPAGLQAALVLARTRKEVVVFDSRTPPRNAASHGIHNFIGAEGLRPHELRELVWSQIAVYDSARLVEERVDDIARDEDTGRLVVTAGSEQYAAREVVLAVGFVDVHPDVDGFGECWGMSIIPCPFCDGYEHRDRRWGIVVQGAEGLDVFPAMVQNWTDSRCVIAPDGVEISAHHVEMLDRLGVELHQGSIASIDHDGGQVRSVTLDAGATIALDTLLWSPTAAPSPLVTHLADTLDLEVDGRGHVVVDDVQRTNVPGLWAAGDVQGWLGAIESASLGGVAAAMIVHGWYHDAAA